MPYLAGPSKHRMQGVALAAVMAVAGSLGGAGVASAQYGAGPPLPPLPPIPGAVSGPSGAVSPATQTGLGLPSAVGNGTAAPADGTVPAGVLGAEIPGVANSPTGAVGNGTAAPVDGTGRAGVLGTRIQAALPTAVVKSSDVALPVSDKANNLHTLPYTGLQIGWLGAFGAGMLLVGVGLRRKFSALPTR